MKTILFIIISTTSLSFLSPSKYERIMLKNIDALYQAETTENLQELVNTFDRIANAEKDKWEPYYYGAFGSLMITFRLSESSEKDKMLDQALERVNTAKSLDSSESEIIALEGYIHMIRVTIDPASRGAQYSGLAMQTFGQALSMDPDNPRAMYLMGQMQYGTAQFFGSDTSEACGLMKKALNQFENDKSESPLAPHWGKEQAREAVSRCE